MSNKVKAPGRLLKIDSTELENSMVIAMLVRSEGSGMRVWLAKVSMIKKLKENAKGEVYWCN